MPTTLPTRPNRQGFTLIEMSVVLTIIALLIGGVLGGQYLLKQSEMQSIVADFTKFRSGFFQFKDQYKGLPGDITDARDYWGTTVNNGDGDGTLDLVGDAAETWQAWQQMALAGLVDGTYTGLVGTGATPGGNTPNLPAGKRQGTGYKIFWLPMVTASNTGTYSDYFYTGTGTDYSHVIQYGVANGAMTNGGALSSREAMQIDSKLDDGKPGTGKIFANVTTGACVTTGVATSVAADGATATYQSGNKNKYCNIGLKVD